MSSRCVMAQSFSPLDRCSTQSTTMLTATVSMAMAPAGSSGARPKLAAFQLEKLANAIF